jgi:hypothetical protein
MLANVVKLRFVDMPVFMDVGQIVSGYTLETSVNGNIIFGRDNTESLGASGKFTDRPTITYSPKIGEDYLRSLLEPVEPRSLLSLIAAGYAADLLLIWGVESINGVKNYTTANTNIEVEAVDGNIDYMAVVKLISKLQQTGDIAFELRRDESEKGVLMLLFRDPDLNAEILPGQQQLRDLLGLAADRQQLRIRYAPFSVSDDILAIQTRSILQIMFALARHIDVPPEFVSETRKGAYLPEGMRRPFTVRSGDKTPENVYARFRYRDYWYWIDSSDIQSKRVFTLMMFMTTLTNRSGRGMEPVLTIPTS